MRQKILLVFMYLSAIKPINQHRSGKMSRTGRRGEKRPRKAIPPKSLPGETEPWRQTRIPEFSSEVEMTEEEDVFRRVKLTEDSSVMSVFNREKQWRDNEKYLKSVKEAGGRARERGDTGEETRGRAKEKGDIGGRYYLLKDTARKWRQNYIFSYAGTMIYLSSKEEARDQEWLVAHNVRYIVNVMLGAENKFAGKQIHSYRRGDKTERLAEYPPRALKGRKKIQYAARYGGVEYKYVPVGDEPKNVKMQQMMQRELESVVDWMHKKASEWGNWPGSDAGRGPDHIETGAPNAILVHCNAGRNRSGTVMAAFMMKYGGFNLLGAFGVLQAKDPNTNLGFENLEFLNILQDFERKIVVPRNTLEHLKRLSLMGNIDDLIHIEKLLNTYGFAAAESSFTTARGNIDKDPEDLSALLKFAIKAGDTSVLEHIQDAGEHEEEAQDPLPEFEAKRSIQENEKEEEEGSELLF